MLFTRCPDCQTTFRVTDEALKQAQGQVRCGRCAAVFNAYTEAHEASAEPSVQDSQPPAPAALPPEAIPIDEATAPREPQQPPTPEAPPAEPETSGDDSPAGAERLETASVDAQITELETGGHDTGSTADTATAPPANAVVEIDSLISPKQVDEVLMTQAAQPPSVWPALGTASEPARRSSLWTGAAALALFALGTQVLHHFRADLAGHATFGPWIQQTYARLGLKVEPRWDVRHYEILDWVATAEPSARGRGSLKITARIRNRGPEQQPYPDVHLRLTDRWEAAVGSRTFVPAEYLPKGTPRDRLMAPGETTRAEIEVVDPGPDAYGFELDVCIELEPGSASCGTDAVFL